MEVFVEHAGGRKEYNVYSLLEVVQYLVATILIMTMVGF
jgi:hypothetical protein